MKTSSCQPIVELLHNSILVAWTNNCFWFSLFLQSNFVSVYVCVWLFSSVPPIFSILLYMCPAILPRLYLPAWISWNTSVSISWVVTRTAKITSVLLVCPSFSCINCRHTCFSKHPVGTVFELHLLSALPELFITAVLTVQTWPLVLALRYPFIICQCYKTTLFQSAQFANWPRSFCVTDAVWI